MIETITLLNARGLQSGNLPCHGFGIILCWAVVYPVFEKLQKALNALMTCGAVEKTGVYSLFESVN